MKYTPSNILTLKPNEIFVYGANTAGRHGAGAAKLAVQRFGAVYGKIGLVGQSYGLPTKDKNIQTLPLEEILRHVGEYCTVTHDNPQLLFYTTMVGCGLAGLTVKQIAPLFRLYEWDDNVLFPEEFKLTK